MRLIFNILTVCVLLLVWSHCASIRSPTGGPKDNRPPKLLSSIPPANQVRYSGRSVLVTFDEDIKINNAKEEIIISPSPGKEVEFTVKGQRLTITPKEGFKPETTYSIQFREGVQDITESNSPVNLKLAFSTGDFIDSLAISGQVNDALLGVPLGNITVAIYDADTFDIFVHTPAYFTKTDKSGKFRLENIRNSKYRVYAFDDKNKNLKVESIAEMYGFRKNPIELKKNVDTLSIPLVKLDSRPLKVTSIRNVGTVTVLRLSKGIAAYQITCDRALVNAFGDNRSEINIWNPRDIDSLKVNFQGTDSLQSTLDTAFYVKYTPTKPVEERFTVSIGTPSVNPENSKLTTTLSFSKPLRHFLLDSLFIQVDTTSRINFTKENLEFRDQVREIRVTRELPKKMFGEKEDPILTLMAKLALAISVDGDTSKNISAPIMIYWPEENGTILIQVNTTKKAYILQLVDAKSRQIVAEASNVPRLTARNISPGDYQLLAILDSNQNGRWDAGNIHKGIEPETIVYYTAPDGKKSIPIRANWEVGPVQFAF